MATSSYLRRMHQRRIIETLARAGAASCADLARGTGMSQPTVSRIVDKLISSHILVESRQEFSSPENGSAKVTAVLGRPSTRVQLDRHWPRFAIVQLEVRNTRLAVLPAYLTDRPLPTWLKHSLECTAVDVAAALNIFGLRHVVLSGVFSELPTSCVDYLAESIRRHAMWARFGAISVRTAPRRRQAGGVSVALSNSFLG